MKNLMITSVESRIGKTTFILALAKKLQESSIKVGYFKPISDRTDDRDVKDTKEFLGMSEDESVISPVVITPWEYDLETGEIEKIVKKIRNSLKILNEQYDVLLIETSNSMSYLASLDLSSRNLATICDAKLLLLLKGSSETVFDSLFLAESFYNDLQIHFIGALMARVPIEIKERITDLSKVFFKKIETKCIGIIPEQPILTAPTVEEINLIINGKLLIGDQFKDNLIVDYMVGAMELEAAMKHFRTKTKKAVIIGGDRPALATAALESDTSVIILTGGIYPPQTVLSAALVKGVPVILVQQDTFSVVEQLVSNPIHGGLHLNQRDKIKAWESVFQTLDLEYIITQLNE